MRNPNFEENTHRTLLKKFIHLLFFDSSFISFVHTPRISLNVVFVDHIDKHVLRILRIRNDLAIVVIVHNNNVA